MNHHGIYRLNILFHLPRLVCVDHHQSIKYSESGIFVLCYFFFFFFINASVPFCQMAHVGHR